MLRVPASAKIKIHDTAKLGNREYNMSAEISCFTVFTQTILFFSIQNWSSGVYSLCEVINAPLMVTICHKMFVFFIKDVLHGEVFQMRETNWGREKISREEEKMRDERDQKVGLKNMSGGEGNKRVEREENVSGDSGEKR